MAAFGEQNYGSPLGAITPSRFFDQAGNAQYSYSGYSSRDGRVGISTIDIGGSSVAVGKRLTSFSYSISATGSGTLIYSTSSLPPGLSLSSNVISGTPTAAGTTAVTVTVTSGSNSASRPLAIIIAPSGNPAFTSPLAAYASVGTPFAYLLATTGNTSTYSFTGPSWLSLSGATLSGTPTTPGVYSVNLTASDAFSGTITSALSITVSASPLEINDLPTSSALAGPTSVAKGTAGKVIVTDYTGSQVSTIDLSTGALALIAGNPSGVTPGDGDLATQVFLTPWSSVQDSSGNVYISDKANSRVVKVSASSGILTTYAGVFGSAGYSGDGGAATAARLNAPTGLGIDAGDNLYICDTAVVRKVTPSGFISTVIGNGIAGSSGDGGPAAGATVGQPQGIAIDSAGTAFIADPVAQNVRRIDGITTVVTTVVPSLAGITPSGIAVDSLGNLYVSDTAADYVYKVDLAEAITIYAGNGATTPGGDGFPATLGVVEAPEGMFYDDSSTSLYVAAKGGVNTPSVRVVSAADHPVVTSVSPVGGANVGGYSIRLIGRDLEGVTAFVGGESWVSMTVSPGQPGATEITASVPAIPDYAYAGIASVGVQRPTGESYVLAGSFSPLLPPTVSMGTSPSIGGFPSFCGPDGLTFLPWKPTITFPLNYALVSRVVNVIWQEPSSPDPCGGEVTYELQFTRAFSRDVGWRTIASGLPSGQRQFRFDVGGIPHSTDCGIRIRARNSLGLYSDYSQSNEAFTIASHPPAPVVVLAPAPGDVLDNSILVTWQEADVKSLDGRGVTYSVEVSDAASKGSDWTVLPGADALPSGTNSLLINSFDFPDGQDYAVRVTSTDSLGLSSSKSYSGGFSVRHSGSFVIDTVPPTGSLTINDGDPLASGLRVKLSLFAVDETTGIKDVRFRNQDEDCWSSFDTFVEEKLWDLSASDGVKTVLVQYRDYADNVSSACDCDVISRVLCGAGNVTDVEVSSGKLYAAFDQDGNVMSYKVLVAQAAALSEPQVTAVADLSGTLYMASFDPTSGNAKIYTLAGTPTLVSTIPSDTILSMTGYNDLLYIALQSGRIMSLSGTSLTTSHVESSAITRLRTNGSVLFATIKGSGTYLSYDGVTWHSNSL